MIFKIYAEGFEDKKGNIVKASYMGEMEAESFQKACEARFAFDPSFYPLNLTYCGCKLFDNLEDAQKLLG